jgi:hypothetical protein
MLCVSFLIVGVSMEPLVHNTTIQTNLAIVFHMVMDLVWIQNLE